MIPLNEDIFFYLMLTKDDTEKMSRPVRSISDKK